MLPHLKTWKDWTAFVKMKLTIAESLYSRALTWIKSSRVLEIQCLFLSKSFLSLAAVYFQSVLHCFT